MSKETLIVDLNGALFYERPFEQAHKDWFALFADLLQDESIKEHANDPDYFNHVKNVMQRYLGDVVQETLMQYARLTYGMLTVAAVREEDLVKPFAAFLRKIKSQYTLALVTTAPQGTTRPILQKVGCGDLFDILEESSARKEPDKEAALATFITHYGKPCFYIGAGDKDIETCKKLGIKTITVQWVKQADIKGDYDVKSVDALEQIL